LFEYLQQLLVGLVAAAAVGRVVLFHLQLFRLLLSLSTCLVRLLVGTVALTLLQAYFKLLFNRVIYARVASELVAGQKLLESHLEVLIGPRRALGTVVFGLLGTLVVFVVRTVQLHLNCLLFSLSATTLKSL